MIHLIILAFGVCMALLCHWILRHTYELSIAERLRLKAQEITPEELKDKRVKTSRGEYLLMWAWCTLLAPLSWVAVIFCCRIIKEESYLLFIYTNRFIEWLKEEV